MIYKRNYAVFDTETTGLLSEPQAEVVEFACIILDKDSLKEIGRFESFIKPKNIDLSKPWPIWAKKAMEINGITAAELKKADSAEVVCNRIIGFLKEAGKPMLVGHNIVNFDIPMMERLFNSCNMKLSSYSSNLVHDTYSLGHIMFSDNANMPNVKLGTVSKAFGVEIKDAHRAMVDVEGNADTFRKMVIAMQAIGNKSDLKNTKSSNGKSNSKPPKPKPDSPYKCFACSGGKFILRTNKAMNSKFYGCSNYPKCKQTCQTWEVEKYKVK